MVSSLRIVCLSFCKQSHPLNNEDRGNVSRVSQETTYGLQMCRRLIKRSPPTFWQDTRTWAKWRYRFPWSHFSLDKISYSSRALQRTLFPLGWPLSTCTSFPGVPELGLLMKWAVSFPLQSGRLHVVSKVIWHWLISKEARTRRMYTDNNHPQA